MIDGIGARDGDRAIDWGKTSEDYAVFRPGYPASLFDRLLGYGVGARGQRILDLATGTGNLARVFAARGCTVVGVDIAANQLASARRLAAEQGVSCDFREAAAEETRLPSGSFDAITAGASWLYFDRARVIPEVYRLLAPGGVLATCHLSWLPRLDPVAAASERLVLRFNPDWSAADYAGEIPMIPQWATGHFDLVGMFVYDESLPFTRATWRGRFRACRAIGAALAPDEIERFDREHAQLLEEITPTGEFTVRHRLDAHVLRPK